MFRLKHSNSFWINYGIIYLNILYNDTEGYDFEIVNSTSLMKGSLRSYNF